MNRKLLESRAILLIVLLCLSTAYFIECSSFTKVYAYKTKNVFLVIMDGVRYSEVFGDPNHQFIPHIWNDLRPNGTIYTNFRNNGITVTVPGHTTMLTGVWQEVKNDGSERPHSPTIFEYYRKETGAPQGKTWVVVEHMNLISVDYSDYSGYGKDYGASLDAPGLRRQRGIQLKHMGDVATFDILKEVMDRDHPVLVMVNFGMTDGMGHSGSWSAYVNAIRDADTLIYYLWLKIQNDAKYRDTTTLIVTTDHGRHLDGVKTGFQDHGDDCEGCRHLWLLGIGPDIKSNTVIGATREQPDIAPTIGHLIGFNTPLAKGNVMSEMLIGNECAASPTSHNVSPQTSFRIVVASSLTLILIVSAVLLLKKKGR